MVLLLIPAATAAPTTLVVDASGGGDYTDLGDAIAAAPSGVRIEVRAGTYTVGRVYWAGTDFELAGAGQDVVTIAFDGSLDDYPQLQLDASASWTIRDVTFVQDRTKGGTVVGDNGTPATLTIERVTFRGTEELEGDSCVFFDGTRSAYVGGSRFEGCWDGVQMANVTATIENNLFLGNNRAISSFEHIEGGWDVDVRNNTFVGNDNDLVGNDAIDDVRVTDNVFVGALSCPLASSLPLDAADWHVSGNLWWDNGTCTYPIDLGTGRVEADPLFVDHTDDGDWTNDDFGLLPGSPAIDAAAGTDVVEDHDGAPRPYDGDGDGIAIADLGAYEWGATVPDGGDTGDTGTGDTGTGDTGTGDTGGTDTDDTHTDDTGSGDTGSGDTDPGDTDSGDTDPGDTDSGDTDSADTASDTGGTDSEGGCGCAVTDPEPALALLILPVLLARRRARAG